MKHLWTILLLASDVRASDVILITTGHRIIDNPVRHAAMDQATRMFAAIGVRVEWKTQDTKTKPDPITIRVRFTTGEPGRSGPLAYAYPFEPDRGVTVMYHRILEATHRSPGVRGAVLAHVLVHEIAHMLMRTPAHSPGGIMKARFTSADYPQMALWPLPFLPADADRIRRALGLDGTAPQAGHALDGNGLMLGFR